MLVRVVNDNVYPYVEKYRDRVIEIAPKGFVEMDFNEAHMFLGTMPPNLAVDANGHLRPSSYKMLRIEKPEQWKAEVEVKKYVCHVCKVDLHTADGYVSHVESEHMDAMVDEDAKEKLAKKKLGRPSKVVKDDSLTD